MHKDIGPILRNWMYKPNDLNVRIIDGVDGKQKLQMRLDLGLLQMELDGRPDGKRPHRFDTYLTYYEKKAQGYDRPGVLKPFNLSPHDCLNLQQESIQYYHRYLALMKIGDFPRVARDTMRNLKVFDFVVKYAESDELVWSFEQYRPYVIMMHTRALASISLSKNDFDGALTVIENGIRDIENYYQHYAEKIMDEERFELNFLQQWRKEIQGNKPLSEHERLSNELKLAVKVEDYERAAMLRDRIRDISRRK